MEAKSKTGPHPQHTDWSRVPVEVLDDGTERQLIVGERVMVCRLRFAPRVVTPAMPTVCCRKSRSLCC